MSGDGKLRAAIRQNMLEGGVPAQHVDEVVDLGMHAAKQANEALIGIVRTGSNPAVHLAAMGLGLSLAAAKMQATMESLKEAGTLAGLKVEMVEVEVAP